MTKRLNSWGGLSPGLDDDDDSRPLLNPSLLFVDGNYALRVNAWCSVAGVTLGLRYRFMRAADGEVVDSAEQLVPTSNRVVTTTDLQLSVGWPLTLELFALGGTPTIGQCFVQVQIVRGRGPAAAVFATILQGYITATNALAWPGSPLEKALDGPGALRSITGTNPGAGNEFSETVPAGVRWQLESFRYQFVTAVAVANRQSGILVDDGALNLFYAGGDVVQAASLTLLFSYSQGFTPFGTNPNNAISRSLPSPNFLSPGFRIRSQTVAIQPADVYSVIQYLVREWLTAD